MISAVSLKRKQTTLLWCLSTDISACHLKKGMPDFHAEQQLVQNRVFYEKKKNYISQNVFYCLITVHILFLF